MRSIAEVANVCLQAQNACNLSGVVHSLAETCNALWEEARRIGEGTDWVNRHPVTKLYVDKLLSLCGETTSRDFEAVNSLAVGTTDPACAPPRSR